MSIRVSPISKGAAFLVIAVGLFTLLFVNHIAGIAFVALGIAMYLSLYRFARKVRREIEGGPKKPD